MAKVSILLLINSLLLENAELRRRVPYSNIFQCFRAGSYQEKTEIGEGRSRTIKFQTDLILLKIFKNISDIRANVNAKFCFP